MVRWDTCKWSCGTTSWGAVISCDIAVPVGHLEAPSVSEGLLKLNHNVLVFYTSTGPPLIPGWRLLLWWWRGSSQSTSSASLAFSHHIHHPQDPENSEDKVMIKLLLKKKSYLNLLVTMASRIRTWFRKKLKLPPCGCMPVKYGFSWHTCLCRLIT